MKKIYKPCKHNFLIKGRVGFCCKECTKCGYWEVL